MLDIPTSLIDKLQILAKKTLKERKLQNDADSRKRRGHVE